MSRRKKPKKKTEETKKLAYEDCHQIIDEELIKRKNSWFLNSVNWIDYEDVCQIIRLHLFNKWDQWDQIRPLKPWLNKIISNQFKNILRNYYTNFAKPCLNCPFNMGSSEEACGFTKSGAQDDTCPLLNKWLKTKRYAHYVKIAAPMPENEHSIDSSFLEKNDFIDFEKCIDKIKKRLKEKVNTKQYELFHLLFIENIDEAEAAKRVGYKSTEEGRKAGYKQIKNTKKILKKIILEIIKESDLL